MPYGSEVGSSAAKEVHAFIDSIERIAVNVVRLTLELADGDWLEFRPGQFVQIEVPGFGVLRSYSPSSTLADLPRLQLLVRLLPGGAMSSYLEEKAQVEDVLTLRGPYGAFFLREEHRRAPHIFVAGGTGLAPILYLGDELRLAVFPSRSANVPRWYLPIYILVREPELALFGVAAGCVAGFFSTVRRQLERLHAVRRRVLLSRRQLRRRHRTTGRDEDRVIAEPARTPRLPRDGARPLASHHHRTRSRHQRAARHERRTPPLIGHVLNLAQQQ